MTSPRGFSFSFFILITFFLLYFLLSCNAIFLGSCIVLLCGCLFCGSSSRRRILLFWYVFLLFLFTSEKIMFKKVFRMFLQETYELYDCIYYDLATSDTSNKYSKTHCNLTFDNDKLIITRTDNGECYVQYMSNSVSNPVSQYTGKTIRFECDIIEATANCHIRIYKQVNGTYTSVSSSDTTSGHLTVESAIDSDATSVLFRITGNNLGTNGTCSFRNIKVYPV